MDFLNYPVRLSTKKDNEHIPSFHYIRIRIAEYILFTHFLSLIKWSLPVARVVAAIVVVVEPLHM